VDYWTPCTFFFSGIYLYKDKEVAKIPDEIDRWREERWMMTYQECLPASGFLSLIDAAGYFG